MTAAFQFSTASSWARYVLPALLLHLALLAGVDIDQQLPAAAQATPTLRVQLQASNFAGAAPSVEQPIAEAPSPEPAQPAQQPTAPRATPDNTTWQIPQAFQAANDIPPALLAALAPEQPLLEQTPAIIDKPAAVESNPETATNPTIATTNPAEPINLTPATLATLEPTDPTTIIREPQYRLRTPLRYPRRALELGQQGTVVVHAQLDRTGNPQKLTIAQSSDYQLLDQAALAAVEQWRFEPAWVDGEAIASVVRVPVNFVIQR